jgi:hypothetical protein
MNPDPVCSQRSDPDPVQIGLDPQHWVDGWTSLSDDARDAKEFVNFKKKLFSRKTRADEKDGRPASQKQKRYTLL